MKLLITSLIDLRQYASFSGDLDYDTLIPALRSAQTFLIKFIGLELLEELAVDNPSEDQKSLIPFVSAPIANLALLHFCQAGNVRITDLGLMRTKTSDSQDAFEWQVERTIQALRQQAFDGLETLLRYLEGKLSVFPSYANSDAYKRVKDQLIHSAVLFSSYYDIGDNRLVFQTLRASMRTTELVIKRILGTQLPALLGTGLSDEQEATLDAARRALVYATIARALREKLVSISDTGVQVCAISSFGTINYKQPASDKQLEISMRYFDDQAAQFMGELVTLLPPPPPTNSPGSGSPVLGTKIIAL